MVRETSAGNGGTSGGYDGGDGDMVMKPAWLDGLIGETFFVACGVHENRRKNEKNIFCLDCCQSFCPHCLPSHHSHPFIQLIVEPMWGFQAMWIVGVVWLVSHTIPTIFILTRFKVRRYVYHDVVRLDDLEKLIDCSYIQPYTINSAKVIFLNQRAQSRSCKGSSANFCFTCDRILQEPFHFCSLSCKVDYMVYQGEDLSSIIYLFDQSDFAFSQFEGLRMDGGGSEEIVDDDDDDDDGEITPPDSILEEPVQFKGSSCSHETKGNSGISCHPEVAKKKKKSGFLPGIVLSLSSRRKGAPHRSPLS